MGELYDPSKPSSYIWYVDANSLYATCMTKHLPYRNFRWLKDEEVPKITEEDVRRWKETDDEGYFLMVDIEVPHHLFDYFQQLPPAPEKEEVKEEWLSDYSRNLIEDLEIKRPKAKKLLTTFFPKQRYVLHFLTLQFYLELGVRLLRIRRVMRFDQKPIFAKYIRHNLEKRNEATSEFGKTIMKLNNNSIFGKCCQSARKQRDIELINDNERAKKMLSDHRVTNFTRYDDNLVTVERKKTCVTLDRPVYLAAAILELSKLVIFKFFYQVLLPKFGSKITILYSDTDSFILEVCTDDLYADLEDVKEYLDTSNYPKDHPLFDKTKKGQFGLFKDESPPPNIIAEFCGLKPKSYAYSTVTDKEAIRSKGVPKSVIKHMLCLDRFKNALEGNIHKVTYKKIEPKQFKVFIAEKEKIALSPFDDKRYWIDATTSVPFGYFK
jgi:hypothetical protein